MVERVKNSKYVYNIQVHCEFKRYNEIYKSTIDAY